MSQHNDDLAPLSIQALNDAITLEVRKILVEMVRKYFKKLLWIGGIFTVLNLLIVCVGIWFVLDHVGPILDFIEGLKSGNSKDIIERLL